MGRSKLNRLLKFLIQKSHRNFWTGKFNGFPIGLRKSKILVLSVLALSVAGLIPEPSFGLPKSTSLLISQSPKEVIDQVWQIIYRDYLDSSDSYDAKDWLLLRRKLLAQKYVTPADSHEAIRGMLESLNDPYTRFLDPKEFKEMRIDTSGELTGVGIQLSLDKKTNNLVVISPIEGTPASKAGVMPKDIILSIDDKSTEGMSIENAVKLIRGRKGTEVTLGVQRESKLIKIRLVRDRIEIHAVNSRLNKTLTGINIGYIRLKQFNANSVREMRDAINNLEKKLADGYVLDLRSNPGGLLEASIEIARLWLDDGIIVRTETKDGIKDVRRANGRSLTRRPVVVLVDRGSASASEILSGAIQDNQRGILIGEQTFGKGLVQSVRGLTDGSGLTVTIAKYLTPDGRDIHRNGIYPDIYSKMSEKDLVDFTRNDLGTVRDKQYMVAENELIKSIQKVKAKTTYQPNTSNLLYAIR